ncbi:hypothetical protein [Burkholderia cenocepacia]|uniref:hypothetical protein n=1 Tax=Burkholderia cenocepacia TaxID=95486 RepID=UPI001CF1340E|nr:hypothetical protein [Burkholderia cenocepacia]MCA8234526.1 hypothetical protein [Burkholderia cenocepacia]
MVHDRHTVMPPSMVIGWPLTKRAAAELFRGRHDGVRQHDLCAGFGEARRCLASDAGHDDTFL